MSLGLASCGRTHHSFPQNHTSAKRVVCESRWWAGFLCAWLWRHFQVLRVLPGRWPSSVVSAAAGEVVGEVGTSCWARSRAAAVCSAAGSAFPTGTGWALPALPASAPSVGLRSFGSFPRAARRARPLPPGAPGRAFTNFNPGMAPRPVPG